MTGGQLVSVCISAYNVESFLSEAVASVLDQTYTNLEVVLLDNGSTDGTSDLIGRIRDDRVRTARITPNRGGYQGMNHALSLAQGELVTVYHSDDVYERTIVEREVAFLQRHREAGAVSAMDHYIDEEGRVFGGTTLPAELSGRELLAYEDVFPYVVRHRQTIFRFPTFMTRRAVLDEVGVFEPETWDIGCDTELWFRIARRYPVGILPERLLRYRVRRRNWSARYDRLRTERDRHLDVMEHYLELDGWRDRLDREALREWAFQLCDDETFRAENHVIRGELAEARGLLRKRYGLAIYVTGFRRRKLRVLLLRAAMRAGLALRARRPLSRVLQTLEYRGRLA